MANHASSTLAGHDRGAVILWALFAPLGAVVFDRPGRAWAGSRPSSRRSCSRSSSPKSFGRTAPTCRRGSSGPSTSSTSSSVSFVAMLLLVSFARGRDAAQARVEALLLNVLPAEVAQRLQSDPNSIADSLRRGEHPLRRRRRLHAARRPARRTRGGRAPRSPLHELRRARRPLRGREDQDDRRLLHGRGGRPQRRARTTRKRWPGSRSRCASARNGASPTARPQPATAHRDQLGSGGGGCDRPSSLPLRPVGGHREHGESHGVARDTGRDPDHPLDVGAPGRRLRDGADRARRREGKGRNRDVADIGVPESEPAPSQPEPTPTFVPRPRQDSNLRPAD